MPSSAYKKRTNRRKTVHAAADVQLPSPVDTSRGRSSRKTLQPSNQANVQPSASQPSTSAVSPLIDPASTPLSTEQITYVSNASYEQLVGYRDKLENDLKSYTKLWAIGWKEVLFDGIDDHFAKEDKAYAYAKAIEKMLNERLKDDLSNVDDLLMDIRRATWDDENSKEITLHIDKDE